MSVHPGESEDDAEKTIGEAVTQFQTTLATSKDLRLLAWSHIYLGRMLDLECKRDAGAHRVQSRPGGARRPARYPSRRRARRENCLCRAGPQLAMTMRTTIRRPPHPPSLRRKRRLAHLNPNETNAKKVIEILSPLLLNDVRLRRLSA